MVGATVTLEGDEVLLLTSGGYGKRTKVDAFTLQKRGGKGLKATKLTSVRGKLVGARAVTKGSDVMVVSAEGQLSGSRRGRSAAKAGTPGGSR